MNKKASIFFPLFAVFLIVILGALAYYITIEKGDIESESKVGMPALAYLKLYDEQRKSELFINKATDLALKETLKELAKNSGYPRENKCKVKTLDKEVIIDESCGEFNIKKNFIEEFDSQITEYLASYRSAYPLFEKTDKIEKDLIRESYTNTIKNLKPKVDLKTDKTLFIYPKTEYIVEQLSGSRYSFSLELERKYIDLEIYNRIYNLVSTCIQKKQTLEECKTAINTNNPGFKADLKGNILTVTYDEKSIIFRSDLTKQLPDKGFTV